jgi:putative transposase
MVSSWQKDRSILTTYLRYPHELQPFIYTTNALERFCKEVKRRTKAIESFSGPEAQEKILFLVAEQMNESYDRRMLRNWQLVKPALERMRAQKYGERVVPQEELVAVAEE